MKLTEKDIRLAVRQLILAEAKAALRATPKAQLNILEKSKNKKGEATFKNRAALENTYNDLTTKGAFGDDVKKLQKAFGQPTITHGGETDAAKDAMYGLVLVQGLQDVIKKFKTPSAIFGKKPKPRQKAFCRQMVIALESLKDVHVPINTNNKLFDVGKSDLRLDGAALLLMIFGMIGSASIIEKANAIKKQFPAASKSKVQKGTISMLAATSSYTGPHSPDDQKKLIDVVVKLCNHFKIKSGTEIIVKYKNPDNKVSANPEASIEGLMQNLFNAPKTEVLKATGLKATDITSMVKYKGKQTPWTLKIKLGFKKEEEQKGGDAQKKTVEIPSSRRDQVAQIQRTIDPGKKFTSDDGSWKSGTQEAWKVWLSNPETKKALESLLANQKKIDESRIVRKGSLSQIIRYALLSENEEAKNIDAIIAKAKTDAVSLATALGIAGSDSVVRVAKAVQKIAGNEPTDPKGGYQKKKKKKKKKKKSSSVPGGGSGSKNKSSDKYYVTYNNKTYVYSDGEYKGPDGVVIEDQKMVALLDRAFTDDSDDEENAVDEAKRRLKNKIGTLKQAKRKGSGLSPHLLKDGSDKPLTGSLKNISSINGTEGGGSPQGWKVIRGQTNLIKTLEKIANGTGDDSDYASAKKELEQIKEYVRRPVVKEMLNQTILGQNIASVPRAISYIDTIKSK